MMKMNSEKISQTVRDHLELGCDFYDQYKYRFSYLHFCKAASLGDKEAQLNLGNLFYDGKGTEKNVRVALDWYKKSAKLGSFAAAYNIAIHYKKTKNIRWAKFWFQKALDLGDDDAANELALLNLNSRKERSK